MRIDSSSHTHKASVDAEVRLTLRAIVREQYLCRDRVQSVYKSPDADMSAVACTDEQHTLQSE